MTVNVAYVKEQGITFLVFDADHPSRIDRNRGALLADLTARARLAGMPASKSALAFMENGHLKFYGTPDLVQFLANSGLPSWNFTLKA